MKRKYLKSVLSVGAAFALVFAVAGPASAGSASYSGGGCGASFTNSTSFAKTARTSGSCGVIGVQQYRYLNGSPGIYSWGPYYTVAGTSLTVYTPSGYSLNKSYHSVLNGSGDATVLV